MNNEHINYSEQNLVNDIMERYSREKNNTIYKDVHRFYMIRFLISCY